MNHPTNEQIASDYELWGEYVDPQNTMTEEQFNALTIDEKLRMIASIWTEEN
jgi:hypothetical protein